MKIIDYIEDNFPTYALSYLFNGDASGIEDEDKEITADGIGRRPLALQSPAVAVPSERRAPERAPVVAVELLRRDRLEIAVRAEAIEHDPPDLSIRLVTDLRRRELLGLTNDAPRNSPV